MLMEFFGKWTFTFLIVDPLLTDWTKMWTFIVKVDLLVQNSGLFICESCLFYLSLPNPWLRACSQISLMEVFLCFDYHKFA